MNNYTVVLTHNRPELLRPAVRAALDQCDQVLVVDNASEPTVDRFSLAAWDAPVSVMVVPDQPPNLSALWNLGLNEIARREGRASGMGGPEWNVALICDDVVIPDGWYVAVAAGLRKYNAAAASTHPYGFLREPIMLTELSNEPMMRMCPWAFMLPGERGLRADERLRWWYCDTHLDWAARRSGGTVLCPGPPARNQQENYWTFRSEELTRQVYRDQAMFEQMWGVPQ